jgi:hypothetical protein
VRRRYSWIPKELIARFVRNCPFCISRRNSSQSPSIGAPKTPSPTSSYPDNSVPAYVYDGAQASHLLRTTFEDDDLSYKTLTPEMDFDYVPTGPQSNNTSVVAAAAAAAAAAAVSNCHGGPSSPSQQYIPDPFGNTNYYYASQQPPTHPAFSAAQRQQAVSQQQQQQSNDQQQQHRNNSLAYAMVEMGMHPFASSDNYTYQQTYGNPYTDILGITRVPQQDECFQDLSNVGRPASAAAVAGVDLLSHHRLFQ